MQMDLSKYLQNEPVEQPREQKYTKEEYAALKKQEREELWAEVDSKAQDIFKDGGSLQGFLDFVARQRQAHKTPNLLLLYSQNPEVQMVKTFDKWKEDGKMLKAGAKGIPFLVTQEYEKDGQMAQGYAITKAYDISQIRTRQPEPLPAKSMDDLMGALLAESEVSIRIADNLPENIQAQYQPRQRTIYVRNGMSENATFLAIARELSCAALDQHDGSYSRSEAAAKAYCAAYVVAKKYGMDVSGFSFDKVCERQTFGQKDPQELRSFLNDVKTATYKVDSHLRRSFGELAQEFAPDEFAVAESADTPKKGKPAKAKNQPER